MTYDEFLKEAGKLLEIDWRKYRRRSARRHLGERIQELGLDDYSQYLERLRRHPEEAAGLPDRMRVTVSRFFRERECWRELAEAVIPQLLKGHDQSAPFRIWSVGCCNGEEPYSLAILFLSTFADVLNSRQIDILATDIDKDVLARARVGCYEKGSLRELPAWMLGSYFMPRGGRQCVDEYVKNMVRFERHNFMEDPIPEEMNLVLCRYLAFTYYRRGRRNCATRRLWDVISPGGALMIGRKERLGLREQELFEPWPGTSVVFRRKLVDF